MPDVEQEVVARLKNRRDRIAKMPPEQQAKLYSFAFNHFVAPRYEKVKLSTQELEQTKVKWVENIIGKKMGGPLDFEAPPEKPGFLSLKAMGGRVSATGGGLAGSAKTTLEAVHNLLDAVKGSPTAPTGLEKGLTQFLAKVEAKGFDEAKASLPDIEAHTFAGLGHLLMSIIGAELGGGAAGAAGVTKIGVGLVGKTVGKAATGAAMSGGATASYTSDPESLSKWIGTGAALDALILPGLGKGIEKMMPSVSNAYERLRGLIPQRKATAPIPTVSGAAKPVEAAPVGIFQQVFESKFPEKAQRVSSGEKLDQVLTAPEYQSIVEETAAKRRVLETEKRAAQKAAKAEAKPKPLSAEEKAVKAEQAKAVKAKENVAAKALQSRLSGYRKRTGDVPTPGSGHYERLKAGETVDTILGPPPATSKEVQAQAVQSAGEVADRVSSQAVAEMNPTAVKAVEFAKNVASEPAAPVAPTTQSVKEKIAASVSKPEPMFKVSLDKLEKATTPEEYAAAKQDAEREIGEQANVRVAELKAKHKSGELTSEEITKQAVHVAEELQAARQRIKTAKVPTTISKKALDAKRKASEISQATRTAMKSEADHLADDPEAELVANLDRVKKAETALAGHPKMLAAIHREYVKIGTSDAGVLAEMLETALLKLGTSK
jgi:hypothetical protein